jgi:threonylcarbamoyladenosine tRNA methylthiotransferase MtaB
MKMQFFTEQHHGQTRKVLFEEKDKNGMIDGYTDNYIKISTPLREEWINEIVDWKI